MLEEHLGAQEEDLEWGQMKAPCWALEPEADKHRWIEF